MGDTLRQQIATKIDTALKTILTTGGYKTNAGNNVSEWLETLTAQTDLPAITWRDTGEVRELADTIRENRTLTIEVELLADGSTAPATMREIFSDVSRVIGANRNWDGLAIDTRPVSDDMLTEKEGKRVAGGLVVFEILYRTILFDDLTQ